MRLNTSIVCNIKMKVRNVRVKCYISTLLEMLLWVTCHSVASPARESVELSSLHYIDTLFQKKEGIGSNTNVRL